MGYVIRPADKSDTQAIARLIEEIELFYGATHIQPVDERLSQVDEALFRTPPLAYALVALDDTGDLIGIASYSFVWPAAGSTHSIFLKELYVREDMRRHGIASHLMAELRDIALVRPGCGRLEWMTDTGNKAARSFYHAKDFTELDGKVIYRLDTATTNGE